MFIKKINIKNFRSIQNVDFEIKEIKDGSHTFSLIGINEAGKSSFLKAISLFNQNEQINKKDYFDKSEDIKVELVCELTAEEKKNIKEDLKENHKFEDELILKIGIENIHHNAICAPNLNQPKVEININLKNENNISDLYTLNEQGEIIKKQNQEDSSKSKDQQNSENVNQNLILDNLKEKIKESVQNMFPQIVFWKSSDQYLIKEKINLQNFANNPRDVSVPLLNCFNLIGIKDNEIRDQIDSLSETSEITNLTNRLNDKVTEHIKDIWKDHGTKIKIQFQITNGELDFLVEDKDVPYNAQTPDQRSDGFRQFVSFLLTVSAQDEVEQLSNSLLLLDEPEVHLHPTAQEFLCKELISITTGNSNNIVIFSTHSAHMIDKKHIERCVKVSKEEGKTILERFKNNANTDGKDKKDDKKISYSQVIYDVFGIINTDYHNELYGKLNSHFSEDDDILPCAKLDKHLEKQYQNLFNKPCEMKIWKRKTKDGKEEVKPVTIHTYIRHSISHSENKRNDPYTPDELKKSIERMREILNSVPKNNQT